MRLVAVAVTVTMAGRLWPLLLAVVCACSNQSNEEPTIQPEPAPTEEPTIVFNFCPTLRLYTVTPSPIPYGRWAEIDVELQDPEGDEFSVSWSCQHGVFSDAHAPKTSYRCRDPGEHQLRLEVFGTNNCRKVYSLTALCAD
jgi:hypothetical protein